MGDGKKQALRVTFDRRLKLEFHARTLRPTRDYWSTGNSMRRWN